MSNVLLTSIGSVAADIAIKSLKRLGHRVVGADIYPREWVADAYNVDVFYRAAMWGTQELSSGDADAFAGRLLPNNFHHTKPPAHKGLNYALGIRTLLLVCLPFFVGVDVFTTLA